MPWMKIVDIFNFLWKIRWTNNNKLKEKKSCCATEFFSLKYFSCKSRIKIRIFWQWCISLLISFHTYYLSLIKIIILQVTNYSFVFQVMIWLIFMSLWSNDTYFVQLTLNIHFETIFINKGIMFTYVMSKHS